MLNFGFFSPSECKVQRVVGTHESVHAKTLISILMGVRCEKGRIQQLQRAIDSILAQTYQDWELLICDDGSDSAIVDLLDHLAKLNPRIRLIREGTLFSLAPKLNACLRQAKGQWIARMDDDDISHPERLQRQIEFLHRNPNISFLGCYVKQMHSGKFVGMRKFPLLPTQRDFLFSMPFVHPTLMFRRKALEEVGGYDESSCCVLCEDYDLLLRMYNAGMIGANLPECLLDYSVDSLYIRRRKYRHRINEAITRYRRFYELRMLPGAWPYVIKPLFVGLLPLKMLNNFRDRRNNLGKRRKNLYE